MPSGGDLERPQLGPQGRPLDLADLQRLALSNGPLFRQAAANVEAMRGAAIQAGAYPNPTFGFQEDTAGTAGGPGYLGGFVNQVIKTANKLQLQRAAATMDLRNAELAAQARQNRSDAHDPRRLLSGAGRAGERPRVVRLGGLQQRRL